MRIELDFAKLLRSLKASYLGTLTHVQTLGVSRSHDIFDFKIVVCIEYG